VSYRHCVLTRILTGTATCATSAATARGIDSRRLVPNVEVELRIGQVLEVGSGHRFVLTGELAAGAAAPDAGRTVGASG